MTLLGKVFTFIVLVLSVIFFVLAVAVNARHINYRDLVENKSTGLKVSLQKEQAKSNELTKRVEQLKEKEAVEQLARRVTLSAMETALAQKDSELKAKDQELAAKQSENTLLLAQKLAGQQELAARTSENDELRKQLVQARQDRDTQFQKFVQTYDQYMRLTGQMQTLDRQSKDLARDFTSAKEKLDIIGISPSTKLDGPPAVNGVVNAVFNNMVEVSIGLDDGVRIGDELDVYRGGSYVGRIRVTRSAADKAVGDILPEFARGFIVAGDRVDSKINEIYVKRPQ